MTVLDDRPGGLVQGSVSVVDGLALVADRLIADVAPGGAVRVVRELFDDVIRAYRGVLDLCRGVTPAQRARIRAAGQAFAAAGGSADTVADKLGQLASHLVTLVAARRPDQVVTLVDVAHVVVREFLAGAAAPASEETSKSPRSDLLRRLVLENRIPLELERTLEPDYLVVVFRLGEGLSEDRVKVALDECGDGILAASTGSGAIVLVPERDEQRVERLYEIFSANSGSAPWCVVTRRPRAEIASGYRVAKDLLALAVATARPPGRYTLDDFLVEYAILREPFVSRRLADMIRPLHRYDVLQETLESLIRHDFNRAAAARALFIHRSTLDYRIRRIEEVTGQSPMTGRGAQLLRAAFTAQALPPDAFAG